jgi:RNA polymerase sigma-70 factor (ECF subfamily)
MEDFEIVEKIKNGDEAAVEIFYNKYIQRAYRTAYLITSNAHTAEDVVQDTFIQCIRKINSLKNSAALKAWFYKTLVRTAVKYAKKDNRCILTDEIAEKHTAATMDEYFKNSKYDRLYEEIDKFSDKLKTTIILFYFNEMSIKEISKAMGCFEGTVKSRLFTAKARLKTVLSKTDIEQGGHFDERFF